MAYKYGKLDYGDEEEGLSSTPMLTNIPETATESERAGQPVYFLSDRPETEEFLRGREQSGAEPYRRVLRDVPYRRPTTEQLSLVEAWKEFADNEGTRIMRGIHPDKINPGVMAKEIRDKFLSQYSPSDISKWDQKTRELYFKEADKEAEFAFKKGLGIRSRADELRKRFEFDFKNMQTPKKTPTPKAEPVSEYRTFYESQKALGKTDSQIDESWQERKIKLAEAGAKVRTAGSAFKEGTLDYMVELYETEGKVPSFGMGTAGAPQRAAFWDKVAQRAKDRGDSGAEQVARAAENRSNVMTLTDLTKREQLIESYNVRINKTSDDVLIPLIEKWDLQNPRFINWPVNKLSEIMGSGDLAALKLALNSVSVEVGKVEFNALGIQQLTDSAAKFMNTVHDPNMKVGELLKVIDTSKKLGQTGSSAISEQRASLLARMKKNVPVKKPEVSGQKQDPKSMSDEELLRALGE